MLQFVAMAGDPQGIQNGINQILANNKQTKIVAQCAASWPAIPDKNNIAQLGPQKPQLVHIVYVTFDGPELKDAEGKNLLI